MRAAIVIAARVIADSQGWEPALFYSIGLTLLICLFLFMDTIEWARRRYDPSD